MYDHRPENESTRLLSQTISPFVLQGYTVQYHHPLAEAEMKVIFEDSLFIEPNRALPCTLGKCCPCGAMAARFTPNEKVPCSTRGSGITKLLRNRFASFPSRRSHFLATLRVSRTSHFWLMCAISTTTYIRVRVRS
jgi:hypothetical protein